MESQCQNPNDQASPQHFNGIKIYQLPAHQYSFAMTTLNLKANDTLSNEVHHQVPNNLKGHEESYA